MVDRFYLVWEWVYLGYVDSEDRVELVGATDAVRFHCEEEGFAVAAEVTTGFCFDLDIGEFVGVEDSLIELASVCADGLNFQPCTYGFNREDSHRLWPEVCLQYISRYRLHLLCAPQSRPGTAAWLYYCYYWLAVKKRVFCPAGGVRAILCR